MQPEALNNKLLPCLRECHDFWDGNGKLPCPGVPVCVWQVRDLYKRLVLVGKDYPGGWEVVRRKVRKVVLEPLVLFFITFL